MTTAYRIFGSEMSPYSVKVRAFFRYKRIPHGWIPRRADNDDEFRRYARLPLVPTVATPDGQGLQDSTPIMETLEVEFPERATHPPDPRLKFLSELLEEFGDEWGNKLMFHHRWFAEIDQLASAQTLARISMPYGDADEVAARAGFIRERMVGRTHFVGSSAANAPLISRYFLELIDLIEPHLAARPYLFGARPAFADFGIGAQLYECSVDPTCGSMIRGRGPAVLDWCHRMMAPRADGPFADWGELAPTLEPLLCRPHLPSLDLRQRDGARSRRQRVRCRAAGRDLRPAAAKVPRALAGGAEGQVGRRRRRSRSRGDPGRGRLPPIPGLSAGRLGRLLNG
jgi:glutathione S-transferase